MTTPELVAMPETPEWHTARYTGIGASESAAACGLSTYKQTRRLYHEKRGELLPETPNDGMHFGKVLETAVKVEWCRRNDRRVVEYPVGMHRHGEHAYMLATPDARLDVPTDGMEIKCTNWRIARDLCGEDGTDEIPVDWLMQSQQQIAVMGWARVFVVVMVDVQTLREFVVHRDENLIDQMTAAEGELWERIQSADPPAVDYEHRDRAKLVKSLGRHVEIGKVVPLTAAYAELYGEARRLQGEAKALKMTADQKLDRVRMQIGTAEFGDAPGLRLQRSHVVRKAYHCRESEYWKLTEKK